MRTKKSLEPKSRGHIVSKTSQSDGPDEISSGLMRRSHREQKQASLFLLPMFLQISLKQYHKPCSIGLILSILSNFVFSAYSVSLCEIFVFIFYSVFPGRAQLCVGGCLPPSISLALYGMHGDGRPRDTISFPCNLQKWLHRPCENPETSGVQASAGSGYRAAPPSIGRP